MEGKTSLMVQKLIDDLDQHHLELVEPARALRLQCFADAKDLEGGNKVYRSLSLRNEGSRLRGDWQRHIYVPATGTVRYQRIDKMKTSLRTLANSMGSLDAVHGRLFANYEGQLCVIRELAEYNRDSAALLGKMLKACKAAKE